MQEALKLARAAADCGEVPVGAVLFDPVTKEIISAAHNLCESLHDPTAHAEMITIRKACEINRQTRLEGLDMYVTLEPCAMCAAAISHARIRRLYYGANDMKMGAVENGVRFYNSPTCHHRPEVYNGILESECASLLRDFFTKMRYTTHK